MSKFNRFLKRMGQPILSDVDIPKDAFERLKDIEERLGIPADATTGQEDTKERTE